VLADKGLLDTYASPEAAQLPQSSIFKNMVYGTSVEPVAMIYNKNLLKAEWIPRTRADLVKLLQENGKDLKGKVASFDPEKSGIGFLLAQTDLQNTTSFWDLAKGFGVAEGKVYGSSGAMREKVVSGEQVIAFNVIGSYALQGRHAFIYIRGEFDLAHRRMADAIEEAYAAGLLGENILGTGFNFVLKTIKGAGAYICGEETALLASIEGLRPEVRTRPPFPVNEGLYRKPTIVNNVETFANLRAILTLGGKGYAQIGTPQSSGPKLLSLDSHFVKPGIYEVAMGTPLQTVIDLAGGFKSKIKAIQIGGPLGGLIPMSHIAQLTVDFESFKKAGFLLGHAGVVSIPESMPMIEYIQHLFQFTADESCGKCFPCRLGSTRGKELIAKARGDSSYKIDRELITDLLDTMEQTSLCALGGGVPLPIKNALEHFQTELAPFFKA
jgi:NADH-quinone oxidoreductase subunit F